jgi:hypothetical protein
MGLKVKNTQAYDVTERFIAPAPEMSENKGQNLEEAASKEIKNSPIFGK